MSPDGHDDHTGRSPPDGEPGGPRGGESYEVPALLAEGAILFPETEVTITIQDPRNVTAAVRAMKEHSLVVVIPARAEEEVAGSVGTLVLLRSVQPSDGGGRQALSKGLWRVRVQKLLEGDGYLRVSFVRPAEPDDTSEGGSKMMSGVFDQIDEFAKLMPGIPKEILTYVKGADSPGKLADICAQSPLLTYEERLDLLRTLDPHERLAKVSRFFKRQLEDLKKLSARKTILECSTCMDFADRAFEQGLGGGGDIAREFLDHVVRDHPEELLTLLAERYGPAFLRRRELK